MKRKNSSGINYEGTIIHKLLRKISACKSTISVKAMEVLVSIFRDYVIKIIQESFNLLEISGKKTLSAREIQTAMRLTFVGDLTKHGISEGVSVATRYGQENRCDLIIKPSYIKRKVKQLNRSYRISMVAMVYLAAVIEYLLAEIVELSVSSATSEKRTRITPRDINKSIRLDEELSEMFGFKFIIPQAGVVSSVSELSSQFDSSLSFGLSTPPVSNTESSSPFGFPPTASSSSPFGFLPIASSPFGFPPVPTAAPQQNSTKRILLEYNNFIEQSKSGELSRFSLSMDQQDVSKWTIVMTGKPGSLYEGGKFKISIVFPGSFPFIAPKVSFETKIYHLNIKEKSICLPSLLQTWSPALTIARVILDLDLLLQNPEPNDALDIEKAALFRSNKHQYESECKSWVSLYATY